MGAGAAGWHDDEVVSAGLPDKRLARRFCRLLDQMSGGTWPTGPSGMR
ncbi:MULTISPECIES: transposase DNA-binding-containing protein [unclassified Bradyrhizobium]